MRFRLEYRPEAKAQFDALAADKGQAKRLDAVRKTLGLLETNLRHPGLRTHKYESMTGPGGEPVFEAYAENKTPAAFRVFWYYGPGKGVITVFSITEHPQTTQTIQFAQTSRPRERSPRSRLGPAARQ